ncbi:MAG TPA: class I SAM-dependent methyltransferase [Actinomycetota bacterium]|jgi:SAM-dependent methyltransferase
MRPEAGLSRDPNAPPESQAGVDFGRTAEDYARYRAGFPAALFERLLALGIGSPGQRVLDLGTGTGSLARGFALAGCDVIGMDVAEPMLRMARRLDAEASVLVRYLMAGAEATALRDGSVDVVACGQAWHWFDRPRAAGEARRVLTPGGALALCRLDYVPLPGNVVEATEDLIRRWDPEYAPMPTTGMSPEWALDAGAAGFVDVETFSFDVAIAYAHEAWRGRIRAHASVGAKLGAGQVRTFDGELASMLAGRFPGDPMDVPHRVWSLVARSPSA